MIFQPGFNAIVTENMAARHSHGTLNRAVDWLCYPERFHANVARPIFLLEFIGLDWYQVGNSL
jgi:hypothetical protein